MSVEPPSFRHPGSPPQLPEVPDGVTPAPQPGPARDGRPGGRGDWPPFAPWWGPLAAAAVAFIVAIVAFGIIAAFVEAAGTDIDADDLPTGVTVGGTIVQDAALIVCAVLFAGMGGRRPRPGHFGLRRTAFWPAVGWAALTMFAFYAVSFVWSIAIGIEESDDLAVDLGAGDSTLNLVVVAVLVALIAPVAEEFFFRGYMFGALGARWGLVPALVAVGIVFGLIHAGGTAIEFLLPLAVLGGLLCLLYRLTDSLLPCMALHAINNAVALGVTLEWEAWQVLAGAAAAPLLVVAVVLPLCEPRRERAGSVPAFS